MIVKKGQCLSTLNTILDTWRIIKLAEHVTVTFFTSVYDSSLMRSFSYVLSSMIFFPFFEDTICRGYCWCVLLPLYRQPRVSNPQLINQFSLIQTLIASLNQPHNACSHSLPKHFEANVIMSVNLENKEKETRMFILCRLSMYGLLL